MGSILPWGSVYYNGLLGIGCGCDPTLGECVLDYLLWVVGSILPWGSVYFNRLLAIGCGFDPTLGECVL